MFEEPSKGKMCPVRTMDKYLSKLPKGASALYMQPKKITPALGEAWYTMTPVGVNQLSSMLSRMSRAAQTSMIYTNHCLRSSMVQQLSDAGKQEKSWQSVGTGKRDTPLG